MKTYVILGGGGSFGLIPSQRGRRVSDSFRYIEQTIGYVYSLPDESPLNKRSHAQQQPTAATLPMPSPPAPSRNGLLALSVSTGC